MFIGDCAPLSFLQTVKRLITTCVDANAFASQIGHDTLLEQTDYNGESTSWDVTNERLSQSLVDSAISSFLAVTSGLLDIGEPGQLSDDVKRWSSLEHKSKDILSAVNLLILAVGLQSSEEELASKCYNGARSIALDRLTFDTSPLTVQAFLLIAIYMLRNCQPNGAFLYFSLAARVSYSIGMHRAEVNARFGNEAQRQRERLCVPQKSA
jgi:hypothetical protein